jgi:hypothetical protein
MMQRRVRADAELLMDLLVGPSALNFDGSARAGLRHAARIAA